MLSIPKKINLPSPTSSGDFFSLSKQTPLGGCEGRLIFLGMLTRHTVYDMNYAKYSLIGPETELVLKVIRDQSCGFYAFSFSFYFI